jgi:hypothetical protein
VKAYGKVPNVGKGIDITKKAIDWEGYVRKLYSDPTAGASAVLKGPYQKLVKDRIKADLMKAMPGTPEKVIDVLAGQLAKGAVAALASGLDNSPANAAATVGSGSSNDPPAAPAEPTETLPPDWVDAWVNAVAQRLLSEGERGIDVAVVTDDLRQCLLKGVDAGLARDQTLAACAYILENEPKTGATDGSTPSLDPTVAAFLQACQTPNPTPDSGDPTDLFGAGEAVSGIGDAICDAVRATVTALAANPSEGTPTPCASFNPTCALRH